MANSSDLKSDGENLEGSSPSSGISRCICKHEYYTHRGDDTRCHGIDETIPKKFIKQWNSMWNCWFDVVDWTDPNIWCKCKKYEPKPDEKNST